MLAAVVVGHLFPIAEEDGEVVLMQRLEAEKGQELQSSMLEKARNQALRPAAVANLRHCQTEHEKFFDPTIQLSVPLRNEEGSIVLDKGSSTIRCASMTGARRCCFLTATILSSGD